MLKRIFPAELNNRFSGHVAALWLMGFILFARLVMGANSIFNGYNVAQSADGIALSDFPSDAVDAVLALFALLALSHLIVALLGLVALLRYRAMVPLMFLLMLCHQLAGRLLLTALPIVRDGASPPGFFINLALIVVLLTGFFLSLHRSRDSGANNEGRAD